VEGKYISELDTVWEKAQKYADSGNRDKAVQTYNYILQRYADVAPAVEYAHVYLAILYIDLMEFASAETHIREAINLRPDKAVYHSFLGEIFLKQKQWDKAIPEYEITCAAYPDNGDYVHLLGCAMCSSGKTDAGLCFLQKACRLTPENPNVFVDTALSFLSSGNLSKAKEYAEEALRLDLDSSRAKQAVQKVLNASRETAI
jgi:tetratricopeptide (TPR) repeat protein